MCVRALNDCVSVARWRPLLKSDANVFVFFSQEMVFRLAPNQEDIIFHILVEAMAGTPPIPSYQELVVVRQS